VKGQTKAILYMIWFRQMSIGTPSSAHCQHPPRMDGPPRRRPRWRVSGRGPRGACLLGLRPSARAFLGLPTATASGWTFTGQADTGQWEAIGHFVQQLIFHIIALILPGAGYWLGKRIFKNDPASEGKP
jgi:hypothetical protein